MNRVTKIRVHLCPLGYPGLMNHFFSPGNELRRVVLNLGNLDFEIVSDFDIRISDFASLGPSTTVENSLQISSFMQNKANLQNAQMNVTSFLTKEYENISNCTLAENKANTKPNKANLPDDQMNVTSILTKDYENEPLHSRGKNKANSKPIYRGVASGEDGTKPISPPPATKQTQFKANTNPNKPNL